MNTMKGIVGSVMAALILIPLQNAQAWDNGNRGGSGDYYTQDHGGYGGPGYYGNRGGSGDYHQGYRGYGGSGYYGNRGYYGNHGYYGHYGYYRGQGGCWGCGSAGPVIAGLALGAIIGGAIINSAPPLPPSLPPPPGW